MRVPLPAEVLLALTTIAIVFGWPYSAAGLLLAFRCMLRPKELANARRRALSLPSDIGGLIGRGILAIEPPSKTSTRTTMLQAVVIDDDVLLAFCALVWGNLAPDCLLVPGGQHSLQIRFTRLLREAGLEESPFTLGSLRGGGCVDHFQWSQNLGATQFVGRWESQRTLLHYLQEALATTALYRLGGRRLAHIRRLAALCPLLVRSMCKEGVVWKPPVLVPQGASGRVWS